MIDFRIEFGMWGMNAKRLRGASWRATFYDRTDQRFYSGSDDCPWLAIGWALDERALRRSGRHSMTRDPRDLPFKPFTVEAIE